ncbi:ribosomal S19 mitochondrial [Fusarium albosuccineum]|uniref:Ribosomal S19 mitochondrial n=1 Tax=Fusarium albosuccineum TaxID=1237068 RepID=A0A8H4LGL2_9HYPO|nr:ribosomal S19 mitochondrial [Fusarium albosuccineum]
MHATRVLLKRSVWKGPHLVPLPIVWPKSVGDKVPPVRTQARSATILPNFVGLKFEVHNGRDYHEVTITEDMVGHKLGEFSPPDIIDGPKPFRERQNHNALQM